VTQSLTFEFPTTKAPHLSTVKNKTRNSGLTSVCFAGGDLLLAADFNEQMVYLVSVSNGDITFIASHPTQDQDGTPVQTDLMDVDGDRLAVSNFYQGSVSFYRFTDRAIHFEEEMNLNEHKGLHGVRFVPGDPGLVWLTYCNPHFRRHQIVDIETRTVLHEFEVDQQCQDVAFVDGLAVVFARTNHIKKGAEKVPMFSKKARMFATAYVYRLPDDLRAAAPEFLCRWKGRGHIDATKGYGNRIYAANQYLERIDVFSVSETGQLSLRSKIKGMKMPHGLDVRNGKLAVTNYGDQTLRVVDL